MRRPAFALAAMLGAALGIAVGACRAVAGIKDIEYIAADSEPPLSDAEAGPPSPDAPGCSSTTRLFSTPDPLQSLAVTGGDVIVGVAVGPGSLASQGVLDCTTAGCSSPSTVVRAPDDAGALSWGSFATSPGFVYYSLTGSPGSGDDGGVLWGLIDTVLLDGTNPNKYILAEYPYLLVVAGGSLYWVNDPTQAGDTGSSTLSQCPLAGPDSPGCKPSNVPGVPGNAWIANLGHTYSLFADSTNVYVLADDPSSASSAATLYACSLATSCATSPPRAIFKGVDASSAFSFAGDGTYVYATDAATAGQIMRIQVSSGTAVAMPGVGTQQSPTGLAVDGTYLYWATSTGDVYAIDKSGGSPTVVACNQAQPSLVATDDASVYFTVTENGESVVNKVPRP